MLDFSDSADLCNNLILFLFINETVCRCVSKRWILQCLEFDKYGLHCTSRSAVNLQKPLICYADDFAKYGGRNTFQGDFDSPIEKYFDLPLPEDKILATYIWVDSTGENLRCKDVTLDVIPKAPKDKFDEAIEDVNYELTKKVLNDIKCTHSSKYLLPYFYKSKNLEKMYNVECSHRDAKRNTHYFDENFKELPIVSFDGAASQMALISSSDMYLCPRAIYRNPFKHGNHILVMCDTYDMNMDPSESNHRFHCAKAHKKCKKSEPWFAVEQEYFLLNSSTSWPLGWPKGGFPLRGNQYYCGIGDNRIVARDLIDTHYKCCLFAGVPLSGTCAEAGPGQWEYRVGPSVGVDAGDNLWISRFILIMLAESYGVQISFDPKPVSNWPGCGARTSFSTKKMRGVNGIEEIEKVVHKLEDMHMEHMEVYDLHGGKDNDRRFNDPCETENFTEFSAGITRHSCSISIPLKVATNQKGYIEDRRPASNCDPYQAIEALMRTCILNE